LEAGNPELRSRFPLKVVQQVEYGMMKAGMSCLAVDYQDTGGEWLGAILYVTFGNMLAGCYAIRAKGRDQEQTSSQMPVRAKQAGSIN